MVDPADFDEAYYLATYPDVAAAVTAGIFASAAEHFARCGRAEGRLGSASSRSAIASGIAHTHEAQVCGQLFAGTAAWPKAGRRNPPAPANPLQEFLDRRNDGPGIWKWRHYLEIYHRHLAGFRARPIHVVEIGVFSGGSLEMWREYFGPKATLHGVDIEPTCRAYERPGTRVHVGDQSDPRFWEDFRAAVPELDVVIDDGGHQYDQQRTTLEQLLPHLRPGGVYICEDIHGRYNEFGGYVAGLAQMLHAGQVHDDLVDPERRLTSPATPFQVAIRSIHYYAQMVVIERHVSGAAEFVAPRRGSQWQPFLR